MYLFAQVQQENMLFLQLQVLPGGDSILAPHGEGRNKIVEMFLNRESDYAIL